MKKLAAIFLAGMIIFGLACCDKKTYSKQSFVFGGSMPFCVEMDGKNAEAAHGEMLKTLNELNGQININDERLNSDIKKLNAARAGERIKLGEHAFYLLQKSKEIYAETGGAFNIAALLLGRLWGVDTLSLKDFASTKTAPQAEEINALKEICNLDNLILFDSGEAMKTIDGLSVDLGGIAKGYADDLMREICAKHKIKTARINLAGNLLHHGKQKSQAIKVINPSKTNEFLCAFKSAKDETASTSGDYQRFKYIKSGQTSLKACHIIDSRRGMPYSIIFDGVEYKEDESRIISCTAITHNSMYADAYTTAACVNGIEWAADFFSQKGIKAIIATSDGRIAFVGGIELKETDKYSAYKNYAPI